MPQPRFLPLNYLVDDLPGDWSIADGALSSLIVTGQRSWETGQTRTVALDLTFSGDLSFAIAGLENVTLVLPGATNSAFTVEADLGNPFELRITNIIAKLLVETDLLRPVEWDAVEERWTELGTPFEVDFAIGTVTVTSDMNVEFTVAGDLTIPAVAVGDTGFVVETTGLKLYLSSSQTPPPGREPGFRGFGLENVTVHFPRELDVGIEPDELAVSGLIVGTGGMSAMLSGTWSPTWDGTTPSGSGSGTFAGFAFALRRIEVVVIQNAVTSGLISGELALPFLDEVVKVDLCLTGDGGFTLQVTSATMPAASTDPTSDDTGFVAVLSKPGLGVFRLQSLALDIDGGDFLLSLGGDVTLEVGAPAVKWPTIAFDGLRIGSDGAVKIPGGWITLPEPVALDLVGFKMEISEVGFGTETNGRRWVGCSGGLTLVAGLTAGASVEGLRVAWDPSEPEPTPELSLRGIGIELEIPEAIHLTGSVSMEQSGAGFAFRGAAALKLVSLGVSVDVGVVIGRNTLADPYTYLLLTAAVRLPVGIPIGCTGAAIYGFIGLLGVNMAPGRDTTMSWYQWYKEAPPEFDLTSITKWVDERDSFALGAGIVIGTLPDGAYSVSAKAILLVLLPGPVIMVQGQANILEVAPDVGDAASSGALNALAVLDCNEGFLEIAIDAGWSVPKVLDISAASEAYFSFADPADWHLYIGQRDPESLRIRADVLGLLHADCFFMLSDTGVEQGFQAQLGDEWSFGPVTLAMRAWLGLDTSLVWRPVQVTGVISLGGEVSLTIAGFGIGVLVEASLELKAPTPYWVHGMLAITVSLPFPIPELAADVEFTWEEEATPDLSNPVESMAVAHEKFTTAWATPIYELLTDVDPATTTAEVAVVPLDGRPVICFGQAMNCEVSGISGNPPVSSSIVGDYTLEWILRDLELHVWHKNQPVATAGWRDVSGTIKGVWLADVKGDAMVGRKLQLLSKNPFWYAKNSSRSIVDRFLSRVSDWPCVDITAPAEVSIDWEDKAAGTVLGVFFLEDDATFICPTTVSASVNTAPVNPWGHTRVALYSSNNPSQVWIALPATSVRVRIALSVSPGALPVTVRAWGAGVTLASEVVVPAAPRSVVFQAVGMEWLQIDSPGAAGIRIFHIRYLSATVANDYAVRQAGAASLAVAAEQWNSTDELLEPSSWYRLVVRTRCSRKDFHDSIVTDDYTSVAFFQTVGPPAIQPAGMIPVWVDEEYPVRGEPEDLSGYVKWAIPEDGAAAVYRGYDPGAIMNENYVEQMYGSRVRLALVEDGGAAIVDADGNEETFENVWGRTSKVTLAVSEASWVSRFSACSGVGISIPGDTTIFAQTSNLFEDSFDADLTAWEQVTQGTFGVPDWAISDGTVIQTGVVHGGDNTFAEVPKWGTMLVAGDSEWEDYELHLSCRAQDGAVGAAFRYTDSNNYFRFSMDRNLGYRRLVRVSAGVVTELWVDTTVPAGGAWLELRLSCSGSRVRIQVGDELLVDMTDIDGPRAGRVGLYTWGAGDGAFDGVLVRPLLRLRAQTSYQASLLGAMVLLADDLRYGVSHHWQSAGTGAATVGTAIGAGPGGEDTMHFSATVASMSGHADAAMLFTGHAVGWPADCTFEADVRGAGTGRLGLAVRWTSVTDFVMFEWDTATGGAMLVSCEGGIYGGPLWTGTLALSDTDWHHVTFTVEGDAFRVEVDGVEVCNVTIAAHTTGMIALGINGATGAHFANLAAWTAPETELLRWHFSTSQYDGWADHLGSFEGQVVDELLADPPPDIVTARAIAWATGVAADAALAAARANLLTASDVERSGLVTLCQAAADARWAEVAAGWDALANGQFALGYRALPPRMELIGLRGTACHALLIESPEPMDQHRLGWVLRGESGTAWTDVSSAFLVWNPDATRALLFYAAAADFAAGRYQLEATYHADVGAERPALRRAGSSQSEVARIEFEVP